MRRDERRDNYKLAEKNSVSTQKMQSSEKRLRDAPPSDTPELLAPLMNPEWIMHERDLKFNDTQLVWKV